jgi:citrate synthase
MSVTKLEYKEGLEDIVVTTSEICYIDGVNGVLAYRGIDIHELARQATFEEVAHLLWFGHLPNRRELDKLGTSLAANRALPSDALAFLKSLPKATPPMDVLRTITSLLSIYDSDGADNSHEANVRRSIRLTAQLATILAAFDRLRNGKEPLAPRPELRHAANFLYMLTGKVPDTVSERALDVALVLHADHELNASTFAARVTASTLTDMYSAITSAVGTLKGPLHGGANEAAMRMLREIGDVANVERYIENALAQKKKIPGFGHRVYRTEDPRATHLRRISRELGETLNNRKWYELSQKIEDVVKREKALNCNVDFYSASVYHMLGIPIDLYTPIFAVSRISGWTAHVLEQLDHNRLIRPRAEYTGPAYPQPYVPMDKR